MDNDSNGNSPRLSNDMMLSDSGYSSELLQLCRCLSPCNCGIPNDRDPEDNAVQETGDEDVQWGEWDPWPSWSKWFQLTERGLSSDITGKVS